MLTTVDFNSSLWSEPWFRKLTANSKLLFIYLCTNDHRLHTGLYPIDIETINFETKIPQEQIQGGLSELNPEVEYDNKEEVIWIRNHVKYQFMKKNKISEKMVKRLAKELISLSYHPFLEKFYDKYSDLWIGYPEHMDTVYKYPSDKDKGKDKDTGKGEDGDEWEKENKADTERLREIRDHLFGGSGN